jgi:hypothetical protein
MGDMRFGLMGACIASFYDRNRLGSVFKPGNRVTSQLRADQTEASLPLMEFRQPRNFRSAAPADRLRGGLQDPVHRGRKKLRSAAPEPVGGGD